LHDPNLTVFDDPPVCTGDSI